MKLGRNDPCSCGSGKKFKHCCQKETEFRPSSSMAPSSVELSHLFALFDEGRYAELESKARSLLENYPNSEFVWQLLGVVLGKLGKLSEAEASYKRAIMIKPDYAEAHNNLGNILKYLSKAYEAEASYKRAIMIMPDYAEAHNNLGNILKQLGRLAEAEASYKQAITINPDYAQAYYNLGISLQDLDRQKDAEASYKQAIELQPNFAEAHNNLGNVMKAQGFFTECEVFIRHALELKPDYAVAHASLGNTLQAQGKFTEAEASYRRALELDPDYLEGYNGLLFTLNFSTSHGPSYKLEQACQFGRIAAGKVKVRFSAWHCAELPERLRVGLVSGDLCNHVVGYFLEGLLEHINPARIELYAYPTNYKEDETTARMRPYFSAWQSIAGKSDEDAANLIHAAGVHVLLDISGHTADNRLPVFSWKPAPVQVSWLGYFATTGMPEMDYLLADEVGVPEDQREQFTESVWYLPDTRLCFTAPCAEIPVAPLPAKSNNVITFGCFQNLSKLGDDVLSAWGEIFAALPSARLRIQCNQLGDQTQAEMLIKRLQHYCIDPSRVVLLGAVSREDYLAAHAEVDLILDTFPYPGGTTTCEALWMGVPTLTLAGKNLLARQGASLLTAVGLTEWVAENKEEYINKAISLSRDLSMLASLRAGLRHQVLASPLFNAKRFARSLESALWGMWQAHCPSN